MDATRSTGNGVIHAETWVVRFSDGRSVGVEVTQHRAGPMEWWESYSEWPGLPHHISTGGFNAEHAVNRLVAYGINSSDGADAVGVRAIVPPAPVASITPNEHDGAAA